MSNQTVELIRPTDITPSPDNPRTHMDEKALVEMAHSFATVGQLQPIEVNGENVVVFGHRRHAAALVGIEKGILPETWCLRVLRQVEAREETGTRAARIVENVQRENMDPMDEAKGYQAMVDLGLKPAQVAKQVGKSPTHVGNRLLLLNLPEPQQELVRGGKLSMTDAINLATIFRADPEIGATLVLNGVSEFGINQALAQIERQEVYNKAEQMATAAGFNVYPRLVDVVVPEPGEPVEGEEPPVQLVAVERMGGSLTDPDEPKLSKAKTETFVIVVNYDNKPVFTPVDFVTPEEAKALKKQAKEAKDSANPEERERAQAARELAAYRREQLSSIVASRHQASAVDAQLFSTALLTISNSTAKTMASLMHIEAIDDEFGKKDYITPVVQAAIAASGQSASRVKAALIIATVAPLAFSVVDSPSRQVARDILVTLGYTLHSTER